MLSLWCPIGRLVEVGRSLELSICRFEGEPSIERLMGLIKTDVSYPLSTSPLNVDSPKGKLVMWLTVHYASTHQMQIFSFPRWWEKSMANSLVCFSGFDRIPNSRMLCKTQFVNFHRLMSPHLHLSMNDERRSICRIERRCFVRCLVDRRLKGHTSNVQGRDKVNCFANSDTWTVQAVYSARWSNRRQRNPNELLSSGRRR